MKSLNDVNIHDVVNLWCNNNENAILKYGYISNWDVSNVTNMEKLFKNKIHFNDFINNWDVSNVTNMFGMFYNATSFNKNINNSNVTNMGGMFL